MRPFFSIIIPTKARPKMIWMTLYSLMHQTFTDFEVIVSDNDAAVPCKDTVDLFPDERIRYVHTPKDLSMSENWEYGLQYASGRYVGYIQDKMFYYEDALQIFHDKIEENAYPASIHGLMDTMVLYDDDDDYSRSGVIHQQERSEKVLTYTSEEIVDKLLSWSEYGDELFIAPFEASVMGGMVRKDVLDAIKERHGKVFVSNIPDAGVNLLIAAYGEKHVTFMIPTFCFRGLDGFKKKTTGQSCASSFAGMRRFTDMFPKKHWDAAIIPGYEATNVNLVTGEYNYLIGIEEKLHGKKQNRANAIMGVARHTGMYRKDQYPPAEQIQLLREAEVSLTDKEKTLLDELRQNYPITPAGVKQILLPPHLKNVRSQVVFSPDMREAIHWQWAEPGMKRLKEFCQGKKIFCYGAGAYGKRVKERLEETGLKVTGFIETKKTRETCEGIPVYAIEDISSWDDKAVILGLDYKHHEAAKNILREHGCHETFTPSVY